MTITHTTDCAMCGLRRMCEHTGKRWLCRSCFDRLFPRKDAA